MMDSKIQGKLKALFESYTKSLPEKILSIETQWQGLLSAWDLDKFIQFHRDVHSLCGSAGTYGYTELSKSARQMEIHLKKLLGKEGISIAQQEAISGFLGQLRFALDKFFHDNPFLQVEELAQQEENHLIYLIERDAQTAQDLTWALNQASYTVRRIENLRALKVAIETVRPNAVIIDTDFLQGDGITRFMELQKAQKNPSQVFCILPNEELLPRLQAVRVGCGAFFQKPVDVSNMVQTIHLKSGPRDEHTCRILIVDDCESLADYYSLVLTQAGMITRALYDPMDLLKTLDDFEPDLILMDIYMPFCTGLELAAVLRQEGRYTKIPIIFLSTEDDRHKQLSAMSFGADDFLTKPISPSHLISSVRSRIKRAGMLDFYMTTDSLTGLLNHFNVLRRLGMEMLHAKQNQIPLTFIMIDIDHFKNVNDTYGHPVGDIVLKQLAALLTARVRRQDIVGRYGGEEFCLVLLGSNLDQGVKICNELREKFSSFCFQSEGTHFSATFSAGVSTMRSDNDVKSIVNEADQALYQAKAEGRNRVVAFVNP